MMYRPLPGNRYGVEIKVPTVHVECEGLDEVLALLDGHAGVARVFDRHSQALVVDGTVNAVRASLGDMAVGEEAEKCGEARPEARDAAAGESSLAGAGREVFDQATYKVQLSGALNIASAYYFGDLGGVVRRRDGNGQDTFFRPMIRRTRTEGGT